MTASRVDVLRELREGLREQGHAHAENSTVLTAASTLRPPGKAFLMPGPANAFRSACLGPLFARYAVQKGRAVELGEGAIDCGKLGRYHFHVDPAMVPSANNHPFQDWLDKLRDFTGTHSLSPAPLVPWPVYSGTMLHSLSCCLVGLEIYWKVLALAVARELNGEDFYRYQALLGRGSAAEEEIERIISALNPEGVEPEVRIVNAPASLQSADDGASDRGSAGGLELFYHPVLVQAVSNVLGRTIVHLDVLGENRTGGGMHQGVYAPWKGISPDKEVLALPPLCVAWEDSSRTRIVPLVPTSLSDTRCRVLPDQLVPVLAFPQLHQLVQGGAVTWASVKRQLLPTDGRGRCQLLSSSTKSMAQQYLADLIAVMSATFRRVAGLSLQTLVDVRSLLFDLGVGDVAVEELVLDTIAAARNDRLYYNPVCCQLTMRRGLYTEDDLRAPSGRLYLAALAHQGSPDAARPPPAASASPSATGRCAGGVRLLGVDVPTCMPPGMLRVYVSVERAGGERGAVAEETGVPESVFLIVKNTSPTGQTRTARISKAMADEEVALGIQVPLREAGTHTIAVSISPVYGPGTPGDPPLSVAVLDAGQYEVIVEEGADEHRANQGQHGARADYSQGLRLKEEPACLFSMGPEGLSACDKMVCRVTGDGDRMRPLNAAGEPVYHNGDCTHTPSSSGSCCDRKHFWQGLEYDNYPVVFNLSLNCPTHFDASGNTTVAIVWHECESNPLRNSNVFQISSAIIEKFWPDEPECPWYGWEAQLNDVILREMPQDRSPKMRDCPRRKWLSGFVGGVDLNH